MTDIVERLRKLNLEQAQSVDCPIEDKWSEWWRLIESTATDAADEIERLRKECGEWVIKNAALHRDIANLTRESPSFADIRQEIRKTNGA